MRRVSVTICKISPEYQERLNNLPEEVKQRFFISEENAMETKLTKEQIEKIRKDKAKKTANNSIIKK